MSEHFLNFSFISGRRREKQEREFYSSIDLNADQPPKAAVALEPAVKRLNVSSPSLIMCHLAGRQINASHTTSRHVAASLLRHGSKDGRRHQPILLLSRSPWGDGRRGSVYVYAHNAACSSTTALSLINKDTQLSQSNGKRHRERVNDFCSRGVEKYSREFWPALLLFCMMLCFENNAS